MHKYANPHVFLKIANRVIPVAWGLALVLFGAGLWFALFQSPPDQRQGETVRIMYVHVPAAWMALGVFVLMALASAVAMVWRHPLDDAVAKTAAPLGAVFCLIALITGSVWGRPMWGTWWEWDARLTSMFLLLLIYIGYMAVWQAIEDVHLAARIARVVALVGVVNIPIIKFAVNWWNTLHQPASVMRMGGPTIDSSMLWPLFIMAAAYLALFIALHFTAIRTEILSRRIQAVRLSEIQGR